MNLWGERGNKVFWFKETESGNQKLIRPDGTYRLFKKKNPNFNQSRQCQAGWQRSMLFMDEYGIWDATAFGCSMNTSLAVKDYEDGKEILYIFSTCQHAEHGVYPFLSEEQVQQCRTNVDKFYANPNVQAAWNNWILYPICLKVAKECKTFVPIALEDIGDGEQILGNTHFTPVYLGEWESVERLFKEELD